jgi:hypothetical protein
MIMARMPPAMSLFTSVPIFVFRMGGVATYAALRKPHDWGQTEYHTANKIMQVHCRSALSK